MVTSLLKIRSEEHGNLKFKVKNMVTSLLKIQSEEHGNLVS